MLSEEEKSKLLNDLKQAKEEVSVLKKRLNKINKDKEDWFSKKAEVGDKIKEKISTVKDLKNKRNKYTNEVKAKKKERNQLNTKISANIKVLVEKKKSAPSARGDRRMSPGKLKSEIEALEFKLETQPMNFKTEQSVMKKIKDLKKKLAAMGGVSKGPENIKEISKETDQLKKTANSIHRDLQDKAKESQELHEQLINISKEIDDLKKSEEDAYEKFFEEKKKFSKLNDELKEKLKELNELKKKLDENKVEIAHEKEMKDQKSLKEKTKEVEEKISKKKKLTTEDLLVMQRKN